MEDVINFDAAAASNVAKTQSTLGLRQFLPLTWIALGTFATGTESFMIAALLPGLARDLSVTLMTAGQLVTAFGLTYAISSPILSALTAGVGRRNLLLMSMAAFAVANFFASTATGLLATPYRAGYCSPARLGFMCRARVQYSPAQSWRRNAAALLLRSSMVEPALRLRSACRLAR